MARLFAGKGQYGFQDERGFMSAPYQNVGSWADVLTPGYGTNMDATFRSMPTTMLDQIAKAKSDLQTANPDYAMKTYWDDPNRVRTAGQDMWRDYTNNVFSNRVEGGYLSLPQYLTMAQMDPKLRKVWEGFYPQEVWQASDKWYEGVKQEAQQYGLSPQELWFGGSKAVQQSKQQQSGGGGFFSPLLNFFGLGE